MLSVAPLIHFPFVDGRSLNEPVKCGIFSLVLLSGPPRMPSHCPIGMFLDNHIVIFSALSSGHKFRPHCRLAWYRLCQFREMIYNY